uniref:Uncharacterized protein n=1 Tax=Glossina austeni TaxID=7395 RepID=A0A1A9VH98_GLOAU
MNGIYLHARQDQENLIYEIKNTTLSLSEGDVPSVVVTIVILSYQAISVIVVYCLRKNINMGPMRLEKVKTVADFIARLIEANCIPGYSFLGNLIKEILVKIKKNYNNKHYEQKRDSLTKSIAIE